MKRNRSFIRTKVLGISCSPRQEKLNIGESRSDKMLRRLLREVVNFGGEFQMVRMLEKKVAPCEGCYSFSKDGSSCVYPCIHQDDTNSVLEMIIEADALVFSTPIYWGAPSSLLRIMIEKMTALENNAKDILKMKGKEPLEGKPFALLASQDTEGASLALSQTVWALNHMGMLLIPYGLIFEPAVLERKIVKLGLKAIGMRKFEWINNAIRLAARNLVFLPRLLSGYTFDDYLVKEPRS